MILQLIDIDTYFHQGASNSYGSTLRQKKKIVGLASLQRIKNNLIYIKLDYHEILNLNVRSNINLTLIK